MVQSRIQVLTVILLSTLASALITTPTGRNAPLCSADPRETQAWISALRESQFAIVPHVTFHASCEASAPPEALATPEPLIPASGPAGITVSFIVGTDGGVHSLFILQGTNPAEERTVLKAVRSWRYRPAKCNGVPIEAEARVQFHSR